MRRQEMATLLASESSASLATYMKSTGAAVTPALCPQDFAELEIAFNMLTMLPEGWEIDQVDSKHPGPQYESFQRQALTSFCRCTNMPYALAAGTSRDSNFSSNKGDVKNVWEPETKTEQDRIELSVIEPIWGWFLEDAVYVAGLLDGLPSNEDIDHKWTWSPLPNLDEVDSATAAKIRLKTGQSTPSTEYDLRGRDYATEMEKMATDWGKPVQEVKDAIFDLMFERQPGATAPRGGFAPAQSESAVELQEVPV
jgi:capsid protein